MSDNTQAVEWYHQRLLTSPDAGRARQYLRSRGIEAETVRQFQLGWAPDEWDALSTSLDLSNRVLMGTGLGFENSRGRRQDALRARIIFPIFDTAGKPIAVGGRILPASPDDPPRREGRIEPKYKNSPETVIYSKRRTLYALNLAKDDVIRADEIIVCEGYTDVIGLFGAGLPRAVATCGTALSEEHFRTMRNFARRIVLAYDADSAGQSAAASVYQWERKHEVDVAVVRMPKGSDPGEMAQRDPEGLRKAVAEAIPYLQFRLDRVLDAANLESPEGRARAAEIAVRVVAEHPTDMVRDQYLRQIADRCRVDLERLRPLVEAALRGGTSEGPKLEISATRVVRPVVTGSRPGRAALALMIHVPEFVEGRFEPSYFLDPTQRAAFESLQSGRLIAECVDELESRDEADAAELIREISVEELSENLASEREIFEVTAQLIRAAASEALKEVDRDLRAGLVTPESALRVVRDVKNRLGELSDHTNRQAENDLRAWLVIREETSEL